MYPHSRRSQFNSRPPKAGPMTSISRYVEYPAKGVDPLEKFHRHPTPSTQQSSASSLYASRPIATNSRVKQDEQYRKDVHLAFVNNALRQKANGQSDAYDELVDQFNLKKVVGEASSPTPQLRQWLIALSHVVSRLEHVHSSLVEAVVNMPWTTMDTSLVKSYTAFVGNLISARPEYLSLVLGKIAHGFTYQSGLQALDAGLPESSRRPLTRRVVYDRIHYLLHHLLTLVPTLPNTLQPLLVRNFPHKRQSLPAQVTYIRNLLQITEYCPELADRIMATTIDRAIQIDVEIQVELEELEDQIEAQEQSEIFDLDPFDTVVGQEGESSDSDEEEDGDNLSDISSDVGGGSDDDAPQANASIDFEHVSDMVGKLDAILKNIFDHFSHSIAAAATQSTTLSSSTSSLSDSSTLAPEPPRPTSPSFIEQQKALRLSQFQTLLSIFDRTILRTFKTRYTQFLIFWYASLDPEYSDIFQGLLVTKSLLDESQPAVTRAAAASYIGSFVSRAQYVGRDSTRQSVGCLCNFLENQLDKYEAGAKTGGPPLSMAHFSVFYAVTQAVFLIFCFRWRDLLEELEDIDEFGATGHPTKKWMMQLDIVQRVVASELNPLKICSSSVVMQFARVARATGFIYCYSILEANRRSDYVSAPGPSTHGSQNRSQPLLVQRSMIGTSMNAEMNTFFPFDPYKLPRSSAYIQGIYREWSSVAIDDEDDEDEEDEDDNESGSVGSLGEPREGLLVAEAQKGDMEADGLGASFGGMSISPLGPIVIS